MPTIASPAALAPARNTGSAATRTSNADDCESGGLDPGSQYGEQRDPYFYRPQARLGVRPSHTSIFQFPLLSFRDDMSPGFTRGDEGTSLPSVATYRQPGNSRRTADRGLEGSSQFRRPSNDAIFPVPMIFSKPSFTTDNRSSAPHERHCRRRGRLRLQHRAPIHNLRLHRAPICLWGGRQSTLTTLAQLSALGRPSCHQSAGGA